MGYSAENLGSLHVTTTRILMLKDQMELEEFETAAKSSVTTFLLSLRQLHVTIIWTERCLYSLIKYCRRMVSKSGGRNRFNSPGEVKEATKALSSYR